MIAYLFPGQGAQFPGFLHGLGGPPGHRMIRETLQEASDLLHLDVLDLDREEALRSTVAVQLALFVAGVATSRALAGEGIEPDAVAGLSVGAYGAAVACGAIAFGDALTLLKLRAELMERAYPVGYGMLAVSGLNEREIAAAIRQAGAEHAYLANLNAPRQIVVAGSDRDLSRVRDASVAMGARKAERLSVSVPSHCALLEDASLALVEAARQITFMAPVVPYVGNRGARPLRQPEAIRDDLATNLRYAVRWHDSTTVLGELGVTVFVEMPPGRTLTQLAAEALPDIGHVAVETLPLATASVVIRARES